MGKGETMYSIKDLIERHNKCLPISDADVIALRDFYIDLCLSADCLGPEFGLFRIELLKRKEEFEKIVSNGRLFK